MKFVHELKKCMAMLLCIVMLVSVCAFAEEEILVDEHDHEHTETVGTVDVVVEETAGETTEEPVVEETAEEPAAEATTEEPVVEDPTEENVVEEPAEEPAAEETAEESVVEETTEEPVVEEPIVTVAPLEGEVTEAEAVAYAAAVRAAAAQSDCAHENTAWEERGNYYIVAILSSDEDTHIVSVKAAYALVCSGCGMDVDIKYEAEEREGDHYYTSSGICEDCGYSKASEDCDHANVELLNSTITNYITISGTQHRKVVTAIKEGYCEECDRYIEQYGEVTETVEEHEYYEGDNTCMYCYYDQEGDCSHPSSYTEDYIQEWHSDAVYENVEGKCILKATYVATDYYCSVCDEYLGYVRVWDDEVNKEYDHDINLAGVCIRCGFDAECTHPNTEVYRETWAEVYGVADNGDGTHTYNGDMYIYVYCTDCNVCVNELRDARNVTEKHEFDWDSEAKNYVCNVCKAVKACDHPNAEAYVETYYETDYDIAPIAVDDEMHYYTVNKYERNSKHCPDCQRTFSDESYGEPVGSGIELRYHSFDDGVWSEEQQTYVFTCYQCDYQSTTPVYCDHPAEYVETNEWFSEYAYDDTRVEDDVHYVYGAVYEESYCNQCEEWLYSERIGYETRAEKHSFNDNGICYTCGYECKHENKRDIEEGMYWAYAVELSDTQHEVHLAKYMEYYCEDCEWWYTTEFVEWLPEETFVADHIINRYGYCYDCDYHSTCPHKNKTVNEELSEERSDRWCYGEDENGHYVGGYNVTVYDCADCGLSYTGNEEWYESYEVHTFVNGICSECGWTTDGEIVCQHINIEEKLDESTVVTETTSTDTEHTTVTKGQYITYCTACGTIFETSDVTVIETVAEKHTYADGVCSDCEHTCTHTNKLLGAEVTTTTYESTDAAHTAAVKTTTPYTCENCGATGEDVVSQPAGEAEAHTYVEGVCSVCTHTCGHSAQTEAKTEVLLGFVDIVDATHTASYEVTTVATCPDCSNVVTSVVTENREAEAHTYADGVCSVCGHICAHSATESAAEYEIKEIVSIDDQNHEEHGTETVTTTCVDCATVTDVAVNEAWVSEAKAHTFADGVCSECEHACPHTGYEAEEDVFTAKSYASNGKKQHTVTGDVHHVVSCGNCGVILSDEITQADATKVEDHTFSGRKCTLCGYKKPSSSSTTTTTETTPMPEVVDTPNYVEVAADEEIHGVKSADAQRMVEALRKVLETLSAEHAETVAVKFMNADQLLTAEELEKFEALQPVERMVVLLDVLGYDDEVDYVLTLEENALVLTEEATALIEEIELRVAELDEEAAAEYAALVEELFPVVETQIDEVMVPTVALELELTYTTEESTSVVLERYTFQSTDSIWTLWQIESAHIR